MEEATWRFPGWRVAAAAALGVFCATLVFYLFSVLLRPLAAEFGWSRQALSAAYALLAGGAAATAPLWGRAFDRWPAAGLAAGCLALSGAGLLALAGLSGRLAHLYLLFAALGVAAGGSSALAYTRTLAGWFDRRLGLAFGLLLAGAALGGVVHPTALQAIVERFGWRTACAAGGILLLFVAAPVALAAVRDRPGLPPRDRSPAGAGPRAALRSRSFATLLALAFAGAVAGSGAIVHLVALLADRGVAPGRAAAAVSALGACTLAGRLAAGWLLDRLAPTRLAAALFALAAGGLLVLAQARSFAGGLAGAVLLGLGLGGELDVLPYLLSRTFGLRALSTLYGFVWTAHGLGAALGPMLLGWAFDRSGGYGPALAAIAAAELLAGLLALTLPAPSRRS